MALRSVVGQLAARLCLRVAPSITVAPAAASSVFLARAYSTVSEKAKYLPSHEYAIVDGDVAIVGISDFAQSELGDVVYVEAPSVGAAVKQGETFGVVESVKAASDVYSPLTGEVVEVNETLSDAPGKLNTDPFGEGWIIKVKIADKGELGSLLDPAAYQKHVDDGGH